MQAIGRWPAVRRGLCHGLGVICGAGLCLALTACEVAVDAPRTLPAPSRITFPVEAGPILAARCADHLCHGNSQRPFSLYAVGRRRLAQFDAFTAHPLTEVELDANYDATRGFIDAERGRDTTLIRKALGIGGAGGHKGRAVFQAPSDPECLAITRWIEGVER